MSQDLLAAFGETPTPAPAVPPQRQYVSSVNKAGGETVAALGAAEQSFGSTSPDTFEDDDFGDFEDAAAPDNESGEETKAQHDARNTGNLQDIEKSPRAPSQRPRSERRSSKIGRHPFAGHMDVLFDHDEDEYDAGADELEDLATNPEAAMAYSKRIISEQAVKKLESESYVMQAPGFPQASTTTASNFNRRQAPAPAILTSKAIDSRSHGDNDNRINCDVLFDAEAVDQHSSPEDEDEDENWGEFENGLEEPGKSQGAAQPSTIDSQVGRHEQGPSTSGKAAPLSEDMGTDDGTWDDFDEALSLPSQTTVTTPSTTVVNSSFKPQRKDRLPPTNVPPPILLLSSFPSLLARADDDLLNTLAKLPTKQKQILLRHAATQQYLKTLLNHCIALAYIIAGRKLRWKRDSRLYQSMRIGPAGAGGRSGMKLVGVDKSEVAKEDREVVDVVSIYRARMGKLQSAATGAASDGHAPQATSRLPPVPNIGEQMIVKALKPVEGGLMAPRPCAICGLKREERVSKIDRQIDDSFGEWWIEGLEMHVVCRGFWEQVGVKLSAK